jgi:hypothetical protein
MGESFIFECPECEHELTLPIQVAGRTGKCPKCEAVITIPDQKSTDFDLGLDDDFNIRSGDSTIDLPKPSDQFDTDSKVSNELKKLLDELDGD